MRRASVSVPGAGGGGERLLAGPAARLRAKLTEKSRTRATPSVRPLMPAGVRALGAVPTLRDMSAYAGEDDASEAALAE